MYEIVDVEASSRLDRKVGCTLNGGAEGEFPNRVCEFEAMWVSDLRLKPSSWPFGKVKV